MAPPKAGFLNAINCRINPGYYICQRYNITQQSGKKVFGLTANAKKPRQVAITQANPTVPVMVLLALRSPSLRRHRIPRLLTHRANCTIGVCAASSM